MFKNKTHFKVYLIVTIILVISIIIVGGNVLNKYILDREVKSVVSKSIDNDEFRVSVKTWFNYGKVEKAIKTYMKDYSDKVKELNSIVNDQDIKNILSANNYESDGVEFSKSIDILNSKINKFNTIINELKIMSTDSKIMEYINQFNVSHKYVEMYKNYMFLENSEDLENNKLVIDQISSKGSLVLNTDLEVINLLKNNPTSWIVKDNKIYFYSNSLMNSYNVLIEKLNN
ncbi:MAG: hypothetical protein IKO49_08415 [Bacilli bacterium]|nr:hypothetical protein [Bacilli bacterium]